MHYAVPRIFSDAGLLSTFYTEIIVPKPLARAWERMPNFLNRGALRRLAARQIAAIPPYQIESMPRFGLEYWMRLRRARNRSDETSAYLWGGRKFCRLVLQRGLGSSNAIYTFNSAGLELLRFAREEGIFAISEQTIAPKAVEQRLLEEEFALWPNWGDGYKFDSYALEYANRERDEWNTADMVVCGSEFVAEGIRECAGRDVATQVVPYGIDPSPMPELPAARGRALRVLFCGTVGLRKGVQYLLQATARLKSARYEVRVVGPVHLGSAALGDLRSAIEVVGGIPRSEIWRHYAWADVFVLPSLCEGSATVCYEALASGLPVITTPNAGSVVRDGIEGFIVPIRDADAIAARLQSLIADPRLLDELSRNARLRAAEFTVAKYGERLLSTVENGLLNHC